VIATFFKLGGTKMGQAWNGAWNSPPTPQISPNVLCVRIVYYEFVVIWLEKYFSTQRKLMIMIESTYVNNEQCLTIHILNHNWKVIMLNYMGCIEESQGPFKD